MLRQVIVQRLGSKRLDQWRGRAWDACFALSAITVCLSVEGEGLRLLRALPWAACLLGALSAGVMGLGLNWAVGEQ